MNTAGSQLAHAAIEIDENLAEKYNHESVEGQTTAEYALDEKLENNTPDSSSSSEDGKQLKKLDSQIVKVDESKDGEEAYAHLPPHEREIVKRQLDIPSVTVTYKTLFRYATRNDIIIMAISSFCAIAGGSVQPLMTVSCSTGQTPGTVVANMMLRSCLVN